VLNSVNGPHRATRRIAVRRRSESVPELERLAKTAIPHDYHSENGRRPKALPAHHSRKSQLTRGQPEYEGALGRRQTGAGPQRRDTPELVFPDRTTPGLLESSPRRTRMDAARPVRIPPRCRTDRHSAHRAAFRRSTANLESNVSCPVAIRAHELVRRTS